MTSARGSRRTQAPARRTGPRLKTQWENLSIQFDMTAALNIVGADLTPEPIQTITGDVGTAVLRRSILHFDIDFVATDAAIHAFSFGILVMTASGFDQGAFEDPEGSAFQSYLYWTRRTVNPASPGARHLSWDADIRSMRRLRGGYKLIALASHPIQVLPAEILMSGRFLWSVQA